MKCTATNRSFRRQKRYDAGMKEAVVKCSLFLDYVLSDIRKEDYELFADALKRAAEAAVDFAKGTKIDLVMGKYNAQA